MAGWSSLRSTAVAEGLIGGLRVKECCENLETRSCIVLVSVPQYIITPSSSLDRNIKLTNRVRINDETNNRLHVYRCSLCSIRLRLWGGRKHSQARKQAGIHSSFSLQEQGMLLRFQSQRSGIAASRDSSL
eukprot:scaffold50073_cov20-Cyclotella_meneghiniana.AAC.1